MGLGSGDNWDGFGKDGDGKEVIVGTVGRMSVPGGGLRRGWLVEMVSEGVKWDFAQSAELGLSQTATTEIVDEGIPA
jgi:hypothetical protein